jgi:4-amino-4-deoxy-L-arabinose transferase-like glycosyltransferase
MTFKQTPSVQLLTTILLFAVLFSLRFIHLDADPPKTLDPISIGHLSDPGGYVFNARNKIEFGTWKIDEWNLMYVTPLIHIITYVVFLALGVGIAQMNIVPAVFSCLILVIVYLILKRSLNQTYAFIGIILLGMNFQFTMFSRIAVRVMPMLFFTVLTVYLLMTAEKKKFAFFLAGALCFISFTIKGTFLLILPSIVLGMLIYDFFQTEKNVKATISSLGFFVLGLAAVFLAWLFFFYLPHKELFQDFTRNNFKWLTPHSLQRAFKNFWIRPFNYMKNMPVQTFLSSLYLPFLFYIAVKFPRKISLLTWISGFWVISNFLYGSIISYKPWRHAFPLVLPIVFLAVVALYEFMQIKSIERLEKTPFLLYLFLFFWFLFPLSNLAILKSRPLTLKDMRMHSLFILGLSLILIVILALVFKFWPKNLKIPFPYVIKKIILVLLIIFSLFFNLKPYISWACSARHDIRNVSQDFGKAYEQMTIAGLIAPLITLENHHKGHAYHTGYINKGLDFLQKYEITHLFILNYFDEKRVYERDFPEAMQKARLISRYSIWKGYFEFYDLNPPPPKENKDTETLEAETFYGEGGIPRFDEKASGNFAFAAEKNQKALIQLPMRSYPYGNYDVSFSLMTEEKDWGDESRLKIDIADSRRKRILSTKTLRPQDFSSPESYNNHHLSLRLKKPTDIVFRVYKTGKITLWFDKVSIRKCERMHSSIEP